MSEFYVRGAYGVQVNILYFYASILKLFLLLLLLIFITTIVISDTDKRIYHWEHANSCESNLIYGEDNYGEPTPNITRVVFWYIL
jgi:hypothetical protein